MPTIGASFTNNTGSTVTSLDIAYTGEQWRLGATGRTDRLDFQYSTNATSLTTGTWTDVNNLAFNAPNSTGTTGAFDGNAAANRTAISFTITGLSIANGATFWIRWNSFDATGADDGLGVDDFSLTPQGATCTDGIQNGDEKGVDCGGSFCAPCTGNLDVFKFRDLSRNGMFNGPGGETPVEGWQIKVFAEGANTDNDAPLYMGMTDITGHVLFSGIPQGNYIVCEEVRSHWEITTGTVCRTVSVGAGTTNVEFANFENRTYTFKKVSTPATNAAVYFDWTLQDFNGADPGDLTVTSDGVATVIAGGPNLFTITELVPTGWKIDKVVCNSQEMTITDNGITFDTRPAETDVECTFFNVPICTPPTITDEPDPVTECVGGSASFTVEATVSGGATLSYQWQLFSNGGVNWQNLPSPAATQATLLLSGPFNTDANGNQYRVIVTSNNGTPDDASDDCSTTSAKVTLTVNQPATIEAGTAQTICQTKTVDLTSIGASIGGGASAGVWSTSGDGTFTGGTAFGSATAYVPGTNDKKLGTVTLTLTTTDTPTSCPNVADQVVIKILKVDCGAFPWSSN